MHERLYQGVPSLGGVAWGIWLYVSVESTPWIVLGITYFVAFLMRTIGQKVGVSRPTAGMVLIEFWVLSAACVVALSTFAIVWITAKSPVWFDALGEDEVKIVVGVLVGAVTAFLASAWTKDIAGAQGYFWPTKHLRAFFYQLGITGDSRESDAVHKNRVQGGGPEGWGLLARWQRAVILQKRER